MRFTTTRAATTTRPTAMRRFTPTRTAPTTRPMAMVRFSPTRTAPATRPMASGALLQHERLAKHGQWLLGAYTNTSGSNNIALGYQAGYNFTGTKAATLTSATRGSPAKTTSSASAQPDRDLSGRHGLCQRRGADQRPQCQGEFHRGQSAEVLAKVAALPVTEWNYKTESRTCSTSARWRRIFRRPSGWRRG